MAFDLSLIGFIYGIISIIAGILCLESEDLYIFSGILLGQGIFSFALSGMILIDILILN